MEEQSSNLTETFSNFFKVELATSSEQKRDVYRARYSIYCSEFQFEDPAKYPDRAESDEFDDHSLHCMIRHSKSGIPAGFVRLVPASSGNNYHMLPFEKYCASGLDHGYLHSLGLDRDHICEISRLAVDSSFRQRSGENMTRLGTEAALDTSCQDRRGFSVIALAGLFASTALTSITGKTNIFTMMEPYLPDILKKSGIVVKRVGNEVDYHGLRAPFYFRTESLLDNLSGEMLHLYNTIHTIIETKYQESDAQEQEKVLFR